MGIFPDPSGGYLVRLMGARARGCQPAEPRKHLVSFPLSVQVAGILWAQPQDLRAGIGQIVLPVAEQGQ